MHCQDRGTSVAPRTTTGAPPVGAGTAATSAHVTAIDADTAGVGPIVETAIQRSPILYIRNGSVPRIGLLS